MAASRWPLVMLFALLLQLATANDEYAIVSSLREDGSAVGVVRHARVLFLLYDETIIGAEFDDPQLRSQTAYPGFTIMQCAAYLVHKPRRALQIGLGIGSVPSFLRQQGIPTDVVEISEAVVKQAADYFQYERCETGDDATKCPNGETLVMDGLEFLARPAPDEEDRYELLVVDVYTGWNPFLFFVQEAVAEMRDKWLVHRGGVLVMNFVGFFNGPQSAAPKSIYRTLLTLFPHVKCFREMADPEETEAGNIVFYASDRPIEFNTPKTREYQNPNFNTYFAVVAHFQQWEIFQELQQERVEVEVHQGVDAEEVQFATSAGSSGVGGDGEDAALRVRVLTREDHGQDDFADIHRETQEHMRRRVREQFPDAFWSEFLPPASATA